MHRKLLVSAPRIASSAFALLTILAAGTTTIGLRAPAAPQPPSLNLPIPVLNLSAVRIGNSVHLAWTMPTHTTDQIALRHPVTVQVCRALGNGLCANVGSLSLAPGKEGAYTDELPADLAQEPDRLLRYEVALNNHAGKSAGPSNAAYSAAGVSPPPVTGLTGQVRGDGVLLNWQPVSEPGRSVSFRIERLQLDAPAPQETPKSPLAPRRTGRLPDAGGPWEGWRRPGSCDRHLRPVQSAISLRPRTGHGCGCFRTIRGGTGFAKRVYRGCDHRHFPPRSSPGAGGGGRCGCRRHRSLLVARTSIAIWRLTVSIAAMCMEICRPSASLLWGLRPRIGIREHNPDIRMLIPLSAVDQSGNETKRSSEVEETLPSR